MKDSKLKCLAIGLGVALLAGLTNTQAADQQDKDKEKEKPRNKAKPSVPIAPRPGYPGPSFPGGPKPVNPSPTSPGKEPAITQPGKQPTTPPGREPSVTQPGRPPLVTPPAKEPVITQPAKAVPPPIAPKPIQAKLTEQKLSDGTVVRKSSSGVTRQQVETKPSGEQQIQHFNAAGRVDTKVVEKNGTRQTTQYDLGREKTTEVVNKDNSRERTDLRYNRNGQVYARETIKTDSTGAPVSKTVVVNNTVIIHNTTIVNNSVREYHREYVPCRYGYVYAPAPLLIAPAFYVGWYDPFWYAPPVVVGGPVFVAHTHSFSFSWGWSADPWYAYHRYYWEPYPVYYGPSYWVTDWMVAGYLADRYAVAASAEQSREEARFAREEAEKARAVAQQAKDEAEIAEARATAAAAELRVARAEERARKAEAAQARAGQPNPSATPIDPATKDTLNKQIEATIAEKKTFAEEKAKGANPVPPDVSKALADPEHIYPVSKTISVIAAKDSNPAGNLSAGDLLKVEPGQQLTATKETDFVTMRVMTSKGEDDEVAAGTLVKISLKDLQEFDNEFRAKLDQGLELANQNKEKFKQMAQPN